MPELQFRGDLAGNLATSLAAFRGDVVLSYGMAITAGGANFYYTSLGGTGISLPRSGPDAVLGQLTSLSGDTLILGTGAAQIRTEMKFSGLTLNASDLFDLVSRTSTAVLAKFNADVMRAELNSQAWRMTGSEGVDRVRPTADLTLAHNDSIWGGAGADNLNAGAGNDLLNGGRGADTLFGDRGADRLIGGGGDDRMAGGAGADVFVFAGAFGRDRISDFQDGVDRLDLTGAYRITDAGKDTLILQGDNSIRLVGIDHTVISTADIL